MKQIKEFYYINPNMTEKRILQYQYDTILILTLHISIPLIKLQLTKSKDSVCELN